MIRPVLVCLLLAGLSLPAAASDALVAGAATSRVTADGPVTGTRPPAKAPKSTKKQKRAADRKAKKNYGTGQTIAAVGLVTGASGLVVLGIGSVSSSGLQTPGQGTLNLSAGLLSIGGLVGSSGALGAGIAVDGAAKRPVPVIAGALGLTLGIFAPTFFGVGLGLQSPAFAIAAISTGAASTALAGLQMAQTDANRPKRWLKPRIDPVNRRLVLAGSF